MANAEATLSPRPFGQTSRRDAWWVKPVAIFIGLSAFVVYSTWAALQGEHYYFGPYISPFYSPEIFGPSPHSLFGQRPGFWPAGWPFSPAVLILWGPGLFRLTCYYYRGAYYKSFWADPPACAVGEPRKSYLGERFFPLVMQNAHRYFLYVAVVFLLFLVHDVWKALWFTDAATGKSSFGIGVGTLVLAVNVVFLSGYTFGCHSLRHLLGGFLDEPSRAPLPHKAFQCATCFNRRHMLWAWMSLVSVMFADVYVRLCSMGIWKDWRIV